MNRPAQEPVRVFEDDPGTVVMVITGDFDVGISPRVQAWLLDAAARPLVSTANVDASEVTFIDSSAIAAPLRGRSAFAARGGTLRVTQASPTVRRLLELTGLADHLNLAAIDGTPRDLAVR